MTPTISVEPASSTSAHETSVTTREPEPSAKRAFQPGADAIEVIFLAMCRPYCRREPAAVSDDDYAPLIDGVLAAWAARTSGSTPRNVVPAPSALSTVI